jgi:hypothetical protein
MSTKPASRAVARVLDALDARKIHIRPANGGWLAHCPAHDDKNPSLNVSEGNDGRALVHCHAGCAGADVVAALGLAMADLMAQNGGRSASSGITKGPRRSGGRRIVAEYSYRDARGALLYQVVRYASILVSGGAPLALIRGLLGHSSVKMTERYAHLAEGHGSAYLHLPSAAVPENRGNSVATKAVRPS